MIKQKILDDLLIKEISPLFLNKKVWLVGGFIRDLFFNEISDDRDIVCIGSSCDLAKQIAHKLNGTFVELDCENEIYRVVLEDKKTYFDVSRALNDDIMLDANRRDFNINSIFFDFNSKEFFDPRNGIGDLEDKIIRTCDLKNIEDDPLRMLRAFRFQSLFGYEIENELLEFIKSNYKSIQKSAKERVNVELLKLFGGKFAKQALINMDKTGLLEEILPFVTQIKKIPKNTHHHLDLFHHCLETMDKIRLDKPILKLAAFCHDIGKPSTHKIEESGRHRFIGHDEVGSKLVIPILNDLKFSKKQVEYVSNMVKYHIYPSALMCDSNVNDKAKIRFIRKLEPNVEDIIELARADRLSARGPMVSDEMVEDNLAKLRELMEFYEEIKPKLKELPKLLDGKEIMKILNISPSPFLGEVIDALKDEQLSGRISSREEAEIFIKNFCKEM